VPGPNDPFTCTFYEQCFYFGFHHTLGISERQFQDWLEGQAVEVEAPPVLKVPNDVVTVSASLLADFSTDLISGKTGCTRFQAWRATSTLDVHLYYNRSFESTISDSHGHWCGSYLTKFCPDFSIEIIVGSYVHWVHFDAKYRVAFVPARTKTGDPMTRSFQSEDLNRRHTYRDAILGTRGCYVLYPGNTNEETGFMRHPQAEYRDKWPGPSVGAFPLCPSNRTNQEEQQTRLESHLNRLLQAMEESVGYTEEEGFTGA
jgi:hypothetical protein